MNLSPKEIVNELDKYIIGQSDAKKAVAIALRNRYRRSQLPKELRDEITPKNIIMQGPTGVGKTEIARRLAKLVKAPFIKELFASDKSFMTAFFGLFIFAGIFNCFNAHTSRINIFAHLLKNKIFILVISFIIIVQVVLMYYAGTMFRTIPLSIKEFVIMLAFAFTVVPVDIIRKIICKKQEKNIGV